jgi:HCOMODA/2-hydroxy-3-carboxy-muconic semialdehyde decarboxylase
MQHLVRNTSLVIAIAAAAGLSPPLGLHAAPAAESSRSDPTAAVIEQLVEANHILAAKGILDAMGHVTVRSPTNPGHFLMAWSVAPALVTACDIFEFDVGTGEPVSSMLGFVPYTERSIHAGVYKARADLNSVLHSHDPEVVSFSVSQVPLRAIIHDAAFLGAGAPVFDSDENGGDGTLLINKMALGSALAARLGDTANPVVLIRGHGDVVASRSVPEMVTDALYVDKNARVLRDSIALGGPIKYITPEEVASRNKSLGEYRTGANVTHTRDWVQLVAQFGGMAPGLAESVQHPAPHGLPGCGS